METRNNVERLTTRPIKLLEKKMKQKVKEHWDIVVIFILIFAMAYLLLIIYSPKEEPYKPIRTKFVQI